MRREEWNGKVWLDCSVCGQMFPAYDSGGAFSWAMEDFYSCDDNRHCAKCAEAIAAEAGRREAERRRREFLAAIPRIAEASGIPLLYRTHRETGEPLATPPVPHVAQWLWEHRNRNLLVSGRTGVGKSTGACHVAVRLLEEGRKVRYVKLRRLLSEWREARTSDERRAEERFFDRIRGVDLLILDEVADKAKATDSSQEMMYELLDMIADGELRTRLWMLGNFREGVLGEIFGGDEPVFRRIEENFVCVGATERSMEVFHVYKANREQSLEN